MQKEKQLGVWAMLRDMNSRETLSDGESNPDLPRIVCWQAEIMTVRPSKMLFDFDRIRPSKTKNLARISYLIK